MKEPLEPTVSRVGVPHEALRDVVTADAVERVWRRLDANLEPRTPAGRGARFAWALVASAATFALGVGVGGGLLEGPDAGQVAVGAEPHFESGGARQPRVPSSVTERDSETAPDGVRHDPSRETSRPPSPRPRSNWIAPHLGPDPELPFESTEAPADPLEAAVPVAPLPTSGAAPPSWQRLANSGEYEAALFELGQSGGFEAVLLDSNAEQLMLLADVARATGQTQRALAALRRIVAEFRTEPVAPLAAYSLGNLLEKSGDARGAARAFAVYRALSPEGDFAEDALVRQLRTAVERGDREHAEQLAAQYRADFPEGRRGEDVEEWLAELAAREMLPDDAGGASAAESEKPAEPGTPPGESSPAGDVAAPPEAPPE